MPALAPLYFPTLDLPADFAVIEGTVGHHRMLVPVTLSAPAGLEGHFRAVGVSETATSGSDFVVRKARVDFPVGETEAYVKVNVRTDAVREINETFRIELTGARHAVIGDGSVRVTLLNDDFRRGGGSSGEPHLTTFDGLHYDFQFTGDFVLARATSGPAFDLQVRYKPWQGSNAISTTQAIATELGSAHVTLDADRGQPLQVDGAPPALAEGVFTSVGDGWIMREGDTYTIAHAGGDVVEVRAITLSGGFRFLDVSVFPSLMRAPGSFEGLLGNFDGNARNDLSQPWDPRRPPTALAQDWAVDAGASLFDDGPLLPQAPSGVVGLGSFADADVAAARALVAAAGITDPVLQDDAVLDYLATGDATVIEAAVASALPVRKALEFKNVDGVVGIYGPDGESAEGTALEFHAFRTGDLTKSLTIDWHIDLLRSAISRGDLDGATDGKLTFAAGSAEATISLDLRSDREDEPNELVVLVLSDPKDKAAFVRAEVIGTVVDASGPMVRGTRGADTLNGTADAEVIKGKAGDDMLFATAGDKLIGGSGADAFVYATLAAGRPDAQGQIADFDTTAGDRIDLSQIDADTSTPGHQPLAFIGADPFSAPGQLRAEVTLEGNRVEADIDGDGGADFLILVIGGAPLSTADFILG